MTIENSSLWNGTKSGSRMKMELINYNLISLKCVLFIFFAGLGCLFPFLPLHMLAVGLTLDEARIVSIVAPCIALVGPLVAGPLADKLAGGGNAGPSNKSNSGRYLRVMIAVTCILGAIFYLLLMAVPTVIRLEARRPHVTFTSDPKGGVVLQERCMEEKTCHHWTDPKQGALLLSNCRYTCHIPPEAGMLMNSSLADDLTTMYPEEDRSESPDSDYDVYEDGDLSGNGPVEPEGEAQMNKRQSEPLLLEPPHLCYHNELGLLVCQVYTESSKNISINVNLLPATNQEGDDEEWCRYPVGGYFAGRISHDIEKMLVDPNNNSCHPVIQCDVDDPYDAPNSVLAESQCVQIIGDPTATFWTYLFIRSIADIFPTAAITLLDAAVIIATRETSMGRGDVGRQLAWGTFGFSIFAPLVGFLCQDVMPPTPAYMIAIVFFAVFMIIAALILIFANQMPLSPPEWWWHTKCGMLALPMSAVRRYGTETGALIVVLLLLGIFWSALDTYLPWHVQELSGSPLLIGLTITMGGIPALPFLWYAEKIVDYCGHSNLLITAFTFYIIRYTGMSIIESPWWTLLCESFEVFTLALMWLTAILYLRHLIPRRYTVCGQALPVIAHFCLGRFIGAMIGGLVQSGSTLESLRLVYRSMAVAAAIIAIIYFLTYHFYLKPKCAAPTIGPPRATPTIMQSMNGNGSYTPLRVYHNGRARKGQFRY